MAKRIRNPEGTARFIGSGGVAGAISVLGFTALHQLLINPIWFALPAMLVAGAVCGLGLAWSYSLVVPTFTVRTWLQYNLLYLVMFVALGLTSMAAFEPVTSIAALLQTNEPPRALIGRALPVTGLFHCAACVRESCRPLPVSGCGARRESLNVRMKVGGTA